MSTISEHYAHSLNQRIERVRSRKLGASPATVPVNLPPQTAPIHTVRVHRCFSQTSGAKRAAQCVCDETITFFEAITLISDKKADWLLVKNPNAAGLIPFHRAIVIRQSQTEVEMQKHLRKEGRRFSGKFIPIQSRLVRELKSWLGIQARGGNIPATVLDWNDDLLKAFLRDPDKAVDIVPVLGSIGFYECICEYAIKWWNNYLALEGCPEPTDRWYMNNASQGCGQLVSGGYDAEKCAYVAHAHVMAQRGKKVNAHSQVVNLDDGSIGKGAQYGIDSDDAPNEDYSNGSQAHSKRTRIDAADCDTDNSDKRRYDKVPALDRQRGVNLI